MLNNRFGKLVVISESELQTHKSKHYNCLCDCGTIYRVRKDNLVNGKTSMCRKCFINTTKTHGMTGSKFYYVYKAIKDRCNNTTHPAYENYGGRGINNEWDTFESFMDDMFTSYSEGLEIDRIDNDGNYCKGNCRWVTRSKNQSNKRVAGKIPFRGVILVQGRYRASVRPAGEKIICIGHYSTAHEAAMAFDNYCIVNKLDKKLNFDIGDK